MTTRRWAWKQPSYDEIVIDHWSSLIAPKMYRGLSDSPKRRQEKVKARTAHQLFCPYGIGPLDLQPFGLIKSAGRARSLI